MTYYVLVTLLSQHTGIPRPVIKHLLDVMPDVLLQLEEDDVVRTPLGVFRKTRRRERPIALPGKKTSAKVSERFFVRLRSGYRLQQLVKRPSPKSP